MLLKKQVNLGAITNKNASMVSKEELFESSYALKVAQLDQAIQDLPKDCLFVKEAQDVLDHIKSLKLSNASFIYPFKTPLEVLDMTTAILKQHMPMPPVTLENSTIELDETDIDLEEDKTNKDEEAYLQLLRNYHDYGSKLKLIGGLKVLGGLMCALAAVVIIAVAVVGLFLASPWAGPLTIKLTPILLSALIFGPTLVGALEGLSIVGAVKLISNGVKSITLANSMQKFLAKVNEPAPIAPLTPFQQGFQLLNDNPEKALQCFAAVKEGEPQYTQAQSMIAAYTPTSASVPHSPNIENLLATDSSINLEKRRLAKAEREGFSAEDQSADDVERGTSRRRLNYENSEDVQVLIGDVIDFQQQTRAMK